MNNNKKNNEQQNTPQINGPQRFFRGQSEMHHDLYKLEVTPFMKDLKVLADEPSNYIRVEHVHFFHSVSSKGQIQENSCTVGGHFHRLSMIKPATSDSPAIYECSGPLKTIRDKKGQKKIVPFNKNTDDKDKLIDDHKHDVTYIRSEMITRAKTNPEAVKLQVMEAQKSAPVDGILG